MAKKESATVETPVATPVTALEPVAEETSLIFAGELVGSIDRPKSLERDTTGTDDIDLNEIRLPRLAIAQAMSPQLIEGEAKYVDGLKNGDLFNDLTGTVYGRGPLRFIPVQRTTRRIEFIPRSEGGGVVDLDVPAGDDRLKWTDDEGKINFERKKNTVPPRATQFEEFIVLLLRAGKMPEPIVLSIARKNKWNSEAADRLLSFIKFKPDSPIYAGLYTVKSIMAKNDKGTFGVYVTDQAGFVPKDTPQGAAVYEYAKQFAKSLEGKKIVTDVEGAHSEADETNSVATDKEVPF